MDVELYRESWSIVQASKPLQSLKSYISILQSLYKISMGTMLFSMYWNMADLKIKVE